MRNFKVIMGNTMDRVLIFVGLKKDHYKDYVECPLCNGFGQIDEDDGRPCPCQEPYDIEGEVIISASKDHFYYYIEEGGVLNYVRLQVGEYHLVMNRRHMDSNSEGTKPLHEVTAEWLERIVNIYLTGAGKAAAKWWTER